MVIEDPNMKVSISPAHAQSWDMYKALLQSELPDYAMPERCFLVPKFPISAVSHKLDSKSLAALVEAALEQPTPRGPVMEQHTIRGRPDESDGSSNAQWE